MLKEEIVYEHGRETDLLFEQAYIRLRSREGRIYSDQELQQLPKIAATHNTGQISGVDSKIYVVKPFFPIAENIINISC